LSSIVYRLSSIVYRLSSIVYRLSSIVYRLSSIVYRLSSIVLFKQAVCFLWAGVLVKKGRPVTGEYLTSIIG
ncbi:hypothetical protein, partial [Marinomonas flavescens]|uniref:hypothetical protein n=1 Tax=Marinomonas flavescens TaxID=2529379 RepID=UPI001A9DF98B